MGNTNPLLAQLGGMPPLAPDPTELELIDELTDDRDNDGGVTKKLIAPKDDPRNKKSYSFEFDFTDARGSRWSGSFTNHILNIRERACVAAFKSRLLLNVPAETVEAEFRELLTEIAHMTYSLKPVLEDEMHADYKLPLWARDLTLLENPEIVRALWEKVSDHEVFYFRLDQRTE